MELSGKAVFLGQCPPDMVGRLLTLADVAVVPQPPSIGEYYFCPLKLLECAAAGSPLSAVRWATCPNCLITAAAA